MSIRASLACIPSEDLDCLSKFCIPLQSSTLWEIGGARFEAWNLWVAQILEKSPYSSHLTLYIPEYRCSEPILGRKCTLLLELEQDKDWGQQIPHTCIKLKILKASVNCQRLRISHLCLLRRIYNLSTESRRFLGTASSHYGVLGSLEATVLRWSQASTMLGKCINLCDPYTSPSLWHHVDLLQRSRSVSYKKPRHLLAKQTHKTLRCSLGCPSTCAANCVGFQEVLVINIQSRNREMKWKYSRSVYSSAWGEIQKEAEAVPRTIEDIKYLRSEFAGGCISFHDVLHFY